MKVYLYQINVWTGAYPIAVEFTSRGKTVVLGGSL